MNYCVLLDAYSPNTELILLKDHLVRLLGGGHFSFIVLSVVSATSPYSVRLDVMVTNMYCV